ncbi:MAGUK p55 subfamily member 2-like [Betta splendens]|uniref:MAGUK p55 subfamily member 2-like n=1 Tax=Betta splendens TaxID=158456 RepID=A0A6P7NBL9_BETSP|nr:MAGUK p55 subfamily member 2-like [Betta splendens]XP_029015200.1 MAGUK p55 subfamily member 2-like [Betta splendens]XP_055366730.1 MAGUK p55 subfamily member 2-like [Betta splendens]
MPVASTRTEPVPQVSDTMSDSTTSSTTANDLDLIYLKGIMESPLEQEESLKEPRLSPVRENNVELLQEILKDLHPFTHHSDTAAELAHILTQPHIQSLLETHDSVASQTCESPPLSPSDYVDHELEDGHTSNLCLAPDAIRMVGIRKVAGEPLGVTFKVEGGDLVIARILHGGIIDQQALLHVGDIIKEANGREVGQDPRVLQEELQAASGIVVLKILPSYHEAITPRQVFFKCHYDYDPASDNLIPCKEAGLRFETGDILQIVNQDDINWWQARHVEGGNTGLIPSQMLEEKRKAFVKRDIELAPAGNLCIGVGGKKKKKMMYVTTKNAEFDRHEILLYEEVAKVPPFKRKTLILIGAQSVGRRRLKTKLLLRDSQLFGTTIPYTSRKPKKGERENRMYAFTSRSSMETDIKNGRYLEHGEYDGNLYGIRIDSIHEVVEAGRICILDANPQSLKVLRTSEFLPYVVFLQSPDFEVLKAMNQTAVDAGVVTKTMTDEELQRICDESTKIQTAFGHYFDFSIINNNLDETYRTVKAALETVSKNPQWVPVNWVF